MPAKTRLLDAPVTPTGEQGQSPAAVKVGSSCLGERTVVPGRVTNHPRRP